MKDKGLVQMQVTENKIIIDDILEIKEKLENGFKEIYGSDLNLSSSTPDGQMIGLFSECLDEVGKCLTFIVQMLDPYLATGEWLDQRVAYAGLLRKHETPSFVDSVVFHGNAGVVIPSDTILVFKNELWKTDYKITLGANGSAVTSITSIDGGATELVENSELKTQNIIIGLDRVIVNGKLIQGEEEESDGDLLIRFLRSHSINNNDDREGLEAYLMSLRGVKQVKVLENYTNTTDENGVLPHTLNAIVLGGDKEEIATAILKKKIGGCGIQGKEVVEVDFLGQKRSVYFDRPTKISPKIKLRLKRLVNFTEINTERIKELLSNYVFKIGEDVYASRLYCLVNEVAGFEILEFLINNSQSLKIAPREICVIEKQDIEIEVE